MQHLQWDSNFFNFPVGRISNEDHDLLNNDNQFDLIYYFDEQNKLKEEFFQTKYFDCSLLDTKRVYLWKIEDEKDFIELPNIQHIKEYENLIPNEKLYNLAYISGQFSRFFLDRNLPIGTFKKMYDIWIENSVSKIIADRVFIYEDNGKIVGFVTLKIDTQLKKGVIGLIAVDTNSKGLGIGHLLVNKLKTSARDWNLDFIEVATQKENVEACLFYERQDFKLLNETKIYHCWKILI